MNPVIIVFLVISLLLVMFIGRWLHRVQTKKRALARRNEVELHCNGVPAFDTIFVAIIRGASDMSLCDSHVSFDTRSLTSVANTLIDLYKNAHCPLRVRVRIPCSTGEKDFKITLRTFCSESVAIALGSHYADQDPSKFDFYATGHVALTRVDMDERSLRFAPMSLALMQQRSFDGEKYFMTLEAGCKVEKGWDQKLIDAYESLSKGKTVPVIFTYAPPILSDASGYRKRMHNRYKMSGIVDTDLDLPMGNVDTIAPTFPRVRFDGDGKAPVLSWKKCTRQSANDMIVPALAYTVRFSFSRSVVSMVSGSDDHLLPNGDLYDLIRSARYHSMGCQFFVPPHHVVYRADKTLPNGKTSHRQKISEEDQKDIAYAMSLLGLVPGSFSLRPEELQYFRRIGVDLRRKICTKQANLGVMPNSELDSHEIMAKYGSIRNYEMERSKIQE